MYMYNVKISHFHSCNFKEALSPLQIKTFSYHLGHFIFRSLEICDNLMYRLDRARSILIRTQSQLFVLNYSAMVIGIKVFFQKV